MQVTIAPFIKILLLFLLPHVLETTCKINRSADHSAKTEHFNVAKTKLSNVAKTNHPNVTKTIVFNIAKSKYFNATKNGFYNVTETELSIVAKAVLESLFNKVAELQACNCIKKRLQHMYFPVKFAKCLRTPILKNICERLLRIFRIFEKFQN